jgi:hypothetical protein
MWFPRAPSQELEHKKAMTRNRPVLDPYCAYCGSYKGIGFCNNEICPGYTAEDVIIQAKMKSSCVLCRNDATLSCKRCGSMYCDTHSTNGGNRKFEGLNHHIGKCVICGVSVCENCWILDEKGNIQCIEHFE